MKMNANSGKAGSEEYNISFQPTDLRQVIDEKKQQQAPHQSSKGVFARSKKKFRREMLTSKPAYTNRDINLETRHITITSKEIYASDEVLKIYLKKSAMWASSIVGSLSFFGAMNLGLSYFLDVSAPETTLLGLSALSSFMEYSAIETLSGLQHHKSQKYNAKIYLENEPLLQQLVDNLATKFSVPKPRIKCSLKPEIYIKVKRKKATLVLGLPLIQKLNNQELIALMAYHFQYASIIQTNRIDHFFGSSTRDPFKSPIPHSHNIANSIATFSITHLHTIVRAEAIVGAIEASSFDHFISALKQNHSLTIAYHDFINGAAKTEIIPINALTQIVCNSEKKDNINLVECANIKQQVRECLSGRQDSLELRHGRTGATTPYKSQWLLRSGNTIADQLSMKTLRRLGFTKEQLQKTHSKHQAFPKLSDVDSVQQYYIGFYRPNRSITPDLSDGESGSLLTLKAELNYINKTIAKEITKGQSLLEAWDCYENPNFKKQDLGFNERNEIEKTHLELQEIESLLGKKSGLCLAITLSIANPADQKELYQILNAHRKGANLNRAIDGMIEALNQLELEETSATILQSRKSLSSLIGLCAGLPRIINETTTLDVLDSTAQLQNQTNKIDINTLPQKAIMLIEHIEIYKWQIEKQLVDACQKVEERLNINPIHL